MKPLLAPLVLVVALSSLAGCQKQGPPPVSSSAGNNPPAPSAASGDSLSCQSDADCVVSCARAHECCDQLCPPCAQVFSQKSLEALMKWRRETCGATSCPVAKCRAPEEETVAHCTSGQCTIERVAARTP